VIDDWATYRLGDFVPFTAEVYFRLLERMNEAFWPLHLLTLLLGAVDLGLALRGRGRLALALLVPVWVFVAAAFFMQRYAELNWAGGAVGWVVLGQAVLLAILAGSGFGLSVVDVGRRSPRMASMPVLPGAAVAALGLVVHPLIAPLTGQGWLQAETFGLHPDPTAVVTLGIALIVLRPLAAWLMALVPLLWLVASGLTLVALEVPWLWVPFAVVAMALWGLVRKGTGR
jgi:hypothetical protein